MMVAMQQDSPRYARPNSPAPAALINSPLFAPHQIDISCRNTKQSVGVLFTNTNHITLKYVTDNWGTDSNGFKLVVSSSGWRKPLEWKILKKDILLYRSDNRN